MPYIVLGVTSGAVYGLSGVGLVLTYKTSGILNFSQGALATIAAFALYVLFGQHHLPIGLAIVLAVLGLGICMGMLFEPLARCLRRVPLAWQITATVGVLVAVEAYLGIVYGYGVRRFPRFLPTTSVSVFGAFISYEQMIVVGVSLVVTAGLYLYFRFARTGRAMRALVDDVELVTLNGMNPVRLRRAAWIIGCTFAALSGVLIAPNLPLDPSILSLLVFQSFGAAAIGRFSSLPRTWLGGIAIGVASALATKYVGSSNILRGFPNSIPFIVLIVVLITEPRGRVLRVTTPALLQRATSIGRRSPRSQIVAGLVVVAALGFVPSMVGFRLGSWTLALTFFMLFVSLGLLVRLSGQVSLCHAAFAAVGAAAFSRFSVGWHLPWLLALVLAGCVAVPVGVLVAIPAVRVSGLYLALATFGFGIVLQNMFYNTDFMFGLSDLGRVMPRPNVAGLDSDRGFYYLVLGLTALCAVGVVVLVRTRLGRLLAALADSPLALATHGASESLLRVLVFSISAFIAAVAGALYGMSLGRVNGQSFPPFLSITFVVVIVIAAGGFPWYALLAGGFVALVPAYIDGGNIPAWMNVLFGVSAVGVAALSSLQHRPGRGVAGHEPAALSKPDDDCVESTENGFLESTSSVDLPPVKHGVSLEVRELSVRFGGLMAVSDLSLVAPPGRITGLIGPNGAGKTTSFNACSGLIMPSAGTIRLNDVDVTAMGPSARARRGLGRTFQRTDLFDSLTVAQNVAMGREAGLAGSSVVRQIFASRSDRKVIDSTVHEALDLCGLKADAESPVRMLSTGHRRLVELARCLAGPFGLLLLDEPSSGLDVAETERFAAIIRRVVATRGCSVLLVEHDMSLVMSLCEHIYVVDFGQLIFEGSPEEVTSSPVVREAYLGVADNALATTAGTT